MMFIRTEKMKCKCLFDYNMKIGRDTFHFKKGHVYIFYKDRYGYRHIINDEWNLCLNDVHFSLMFEVIDNG